MTEGKERKGRVKDQLKKHGCSDAELCFILCIKH